MNELETLILTLNNSLLTDDERIHAVDELDTLDDPRAIDQLINSLKDTANSFWLRRRIAICLGHHAVDEAVPHIIDIIKDPLSADFRGSFLYSLWGLDCMPYLPFIAETLATDTYESSNHCCFIIRDHAHKIVQPVKDQMLQLLNSYRIIHETGNIPAHSLSTDAESTIGFIEWAIELIEEGEEYQEE